MAEPIVYTLLNYGKYTGGVGIGPGFVVYVVYVVHVVEYAIVKRYPP
jgi:hypothetical protein